MKIKLLKKVVALITLIAVCYTMLFPNNIYASEDTEEMDAFEYLMKYVIQTPDPILERV